MIGGEILGDLKRARTVRNGLSFQTLRARYSSNRSRRTARALVIVKELDAK